MKAVRFPLEDSSISASAASGITIDILAIRTIYHIYLYKSYGWRTRRASEQVSWNQAAPPAPTGRTAGWAVVPTAK